MRKVVLGSMVALVAVILLVAFAVSRARRNTREARIVLNQFYLAVQARDYGRAHSLLTGHCGDIVTEPVLRQRWQTLEQAHGRITRWNPTHDDNRSGSAAGLLPPYVDFTYKVWGDKGSFGFVVVRLVPDGGTWRADKLNILS